MPNSTSSAARSAEITSATDRVPASTWVIEGRPSPSPRSRRTSPSRSTAARSNRRCPPALRRAWMIIETLVQHTTGFAKAVEGAHPDTHVPTCPEWPLRVLVGHIGQEHRWAAEIVRTRAAVPIPDPWDADPGPPPDWSGFLRDGVAELLDAVRDTGAETPVWMFLGPAPARFWLRRMLHDTAMHHVDAALATGGTVEIAPDFAADQICEGLQLVSVPGAAAIVPSVANLPGDGQTLALRPAEPDVAGWLITRTPGGVTWERRTADADVTVTGTVQDLLLVLARRQPPDDTRVTGDRALLDHWLANTSV